MGNTFVAPKVIKHVASPTPTTISNAFVVHIAP